jgi:hypothetical protein
MLIHYREPSGTIVWGPGSLSRVIERVGRSIQVVKSSLPALIIGWICDGMDHSRD